MTRETVFIVDDNPANLGLLFEHLNRAGFRVHVAADGEAALQAIGKVQPDVVLLDVLMPGLDGFETCRRLKADASTRDIPVLFMTALTDLVDEVKGLELGAVDYIAKPFQVDRVLARLRTHLALRNLRTALEDKNRELEQQIVEREKAQAELRAAQRQLAEYAENLELTVRDQIRQLDLERSKLIHADKMAALGRLVASIAHEINNPLQAIQGCVNLALEEVAGKRRPDKINKHLDIVQVEIKRISTIVNQMRDFYRPSREGRYPTDVRTILESVLALTCKQMQEHRVVAECEWDSQIPILQANPDQLKQVFMNVVLNAIDAMPQGGTFKIATTVAQMGDAPAVRITFGDTGQGMSPEVLSHLFEPFYTTKETGSGLGLSVSYGIIQTHGGQIAAESRVGEGTTITVLLPQIAADMTTAQNYPEP